MDDSNPDEYEANDEFEQEVANKTKNAQEFFEELEKIKTTPEGVQNSNADGGSIFNQTGGGFLNRTGNNATKNSNYKKDVGETPVAKVPLSQTIGQKISKANLNSIVKNGKHRESCSRYELYEEEQEDLLGSKEHIVSGQPSPTNKNSSESERPKLARQGSA